MFRGSKNRTATQELLRAHPCPAPVRVLSSIMIALSEMTWSVSSFGKIRIERPKLLRRVWFVYWIFVIWITCYVCQNSVEEKSRVSSASTKSQNLQTLFGSCYRVILYLPVISLSVLCRTFCWEIFRIGENQAYHVKVELKWWFPMKPDFKSDFFFRRLAFETNWETISTSIQHF